jgi:hypothetical protein
MRHFRYGLVLVVWTAFIHVDAQSRVGFTRSLGKPTLPFAKAKGTRLRGSEGQRAIRILSTLSLRISVVNMHAGPCASERYKEDL